MRTLSIDLLSCCRRGTFGLIVRRWLVELDLFSSIRGINASPIAGFQAALTSADQPAPYLAVPEEL